MCRLVKAFKLVYFVNEFLLFIYFYRGIVSFFFFNGSCQFLLNVANFYFSIFAQNYQIKTSQI